MADEKTHRASVTRIVYETSIVEWKSDESRPRHNAAVEAAEEWDDWHEHDVEYHVDWMEEDDNE